MIYKAAPFVVVSKQNPGFPPFFIVNGVNLWPCLQKEVRDVLHFDLILDSIKLLSFLTDISLQYGSYNTCTVANE